MEKQIANKTLNILFDKVSSFVNKQIEERKWESLFVESGELLLRHSNCDELVKDLQAVFSRNNLARIGTKSSSSSRYNFTNILHDQLYKLMMRHEIPHEESEAYIRHFIELVMNWLEQEKPDEYERVYLGECRRELSEQHTRIIAAIEELRQSINVAEVKRLLPVPKAEKRNWK